MMEMYNQNNSEESTQSVLKRKLLYWRSIGVFAFIGFVVATVLTVRSIQIASKKDNTDLLHQILAALKKPDSNEIEQKFSGWLGTDEAKININLFLSGRVSENQSMTTNCHYLISTFKETTEGLAVIDTEERTIKLEGYALFNVTANDTGRLILRSVNHSEEIELWEID